LELATVPASRPDSRRLAFGPVAGAGVLYDLAAGKESSRFPAPVTGALELWFDPTGRRLAVRADQGREIRICAVETGQVLATLPHPERVMGLAWHPSGQLLATTCA